MSITEIKKTKSNLISWIEQLSDANMLSLLDGLRNSDSKKDWWDELPESHQKQIEKGMDDLENGRVITSSEFWKMLKNG